MKTRNLLTSLGIVFLLGIISAHAQKPHIDVLVMYHPDVIDSMGSFQNLEDVVKFNFAAAVEAYEQSGAEQEVRLIDIVEFSDLAGVDMVADFDSLGEFVDSILSDPEHYLTDDFYYHWNRTRADMIGVIVPGDTGKKGFAGWANIVMGMDQYLPTNRLAKKGAFFALFHTYFENGFTFTHEMGHIMGLRHNNCDGQKTDVAGVKPHGYVKFSENWATIMKKGGGGPPRINYFSNPDSSHPVTGSPLGDTGSVCYGPVSPANNVYALNITRDTTSIFEATWDLTSTDIGSPSKAGKTVEFGSGYTIEGAGSDIWGSSDQFHFAYQEMTGDGEIIVQVDSLDNTNSWAKAGVMIRESLNANSKNAMVAVTPGNGISFQWRSSTGGTSSYTTTSGSAPYFIKLRRLGNVFTAWKSTDGMNWSQFGSSKTISMSSTVKVGLAVTSHNTSSICEAKFNRLHIGSASGVASGLDLFSSTISLGGDSYWGFDKGNSITWDYSLSESYFDAAVTGPVDDDQSTYIEVTGYGSSIWFDWRVSSEANYDYLVFYIDGLEKAAISGEDMLWQTLNYSFPLGTHTFRWEYHKDYSVSSGADQGWVDFVSIVY